MTGIREHVGEVKLHLEGIGTDGFDGPVENGVVVGNGFLHDMAATLEETGRWY